MSLVTLTDVKTFLQITVSDYDDLLNLYIDLVSGEVNAYVGRTLDQSFYADEPLEYLTSDNEAATNRVLGQVGSYPKVFLGNYPIASVELYVDGTAIPTANYNLDTNNGVVTLFEGYSDAKFGLTASYTAGYVTTTGDTLTVPNDLKYVILEGVKRAFINGGVAKQSSGNIAAKRVKDFSVQYGANNDTSQYVTSGTEVIKTYLAGNSTTPNRYRRIVL